MRRHITWALPLGTLVAWAWVIAGTGRWPMGDGPHTLGVSLRLAQLLRDGALTEFSWCFSSLLAPHPPGAYAPATLAYTIFGEGRVVHLAASVLLLFLCWDGLRRLGGGPRAGFLGLLWLMAGGLVWQQTESYGIDMVGATFVIQSLSHLAASQQLRNRWHALLWGAWMGGAFLAKYTAPMFLVGPCLVAGIWALQGRRWRQLGLGIVGWAIVALPWYLGHGAGVLDYALTSNADTSSALIRGLNVHGPWWAPENLRWYPDVLLENYGQWGIFGIGIAILLPARKGTPRGARPIVLLAVLVGWLLLTNQMQRQTRYLVPVLPLLALLPAVVHGRLLLIPIAILGTLGALQLYSDPARIQPSQQTWPIPTARLGPGADTPEMWNVDGGVAALAAAAPEGTETVGYLTSDPGGPLPGLTMFSLARWGHRWHLATVVFLRVPTAEGAHQGTDLPTRNGAVIFIGPFYIGDWPSRDFDVIMSILKNDDTRARRWLENTGFVEVGSFKTLPGWEGRVHRTAQ